MTSDYDLPAILVGPLLRFVSDTRVILWLVATRNLAISPDLRAVDNPGEDENAASSPLALAETNCRQLRIGRHAVVHLIDIRPASPLPVDTLLAYDLKIEDRERDGHADTRTGAPPSLAGLADLAPHLVYPGETTPRFVVKSRLDNVLHGSCRRPHHKSGDGLAATDAWLADRRSDAGARPAYMLFTGDQIYADDVAGPMLGAVHTLIDRLGLYDEDLEGAVVPDSRRLFQSSDTYYQRQNLLPAMESTATLQDRFFGGVEKPVFTTTSADNHLITLSVT